MGSMPSETVLLAFANLSNPSYTTLSYTHVLSKMDEYLTYLADASFVPENTISKKHTRCSAPYASPVRRIVAIHSTTT